MNDRPSLCLAVPIVVTSVSMLVLFAVGAAGWPGVIGSSGTEFCEALRPGIIKQPANTWSNLAFVFAGLFVGYTARRELGGGRPVIWHNRMRSTVGYPTLYATAAALVGPMSMALHASATTWGGKIDVLSMFAWAVFAFVYAWARLVDMTDARFGTWYAIVLVVLSGIFLTTTTVGAGSAMFGALLAAFGAIEFLIWRRRPEMRLERRWLLLAAGLFGTAFGTWYLSRTGNPWCDPHSLWQGHALWHVLNGGAMLAIYGYFYSEESPGRR